jgi:Protein of unknown function (DUF1073)
MADLGTEPVNNLGATSLGTPLVKILMSDNIELGASASYELCKLIYSYHPLGAKLVDVPVELSQSQGRQINVPGIAEDRVRKAFIDEWRKIDADRVIANCVRLARIYGVGSIACVVKDEDPTKPLDFATLGEKKLAFNVFDPLNTAGSLIMNQDPNSISFLKPMSIQVQGQAYHPTRTIIYLNEDPIYLDYTTSAYGYVGRSVYQRALFPLKSFLQSMITDDLVTKKAGVIVAKLKPPGSIINNVMQSIAGIKRQMLKDALVGSVLNISTEESVESLNLQNIDTSARSARKNILENIAAAAGMPAKLVNSETLAVAFAEGEEDAKAIARFIDKLRESMQGLYDYFNRIVQFRAWNYDFYSTIKADYKEYSDKSYNECFTEWSNHFIAVWPSLLTEPDSEKIKVANVKLRSIIALMDTLLPLADPDSKEMLIKSAIDNFNDMKILFPTPFKIDAKKMAKYSEEQIKKSQETGGETGAGGAKPPKTKGFGGAAFGSSGSTSVSAKGDAEEAIVDLFNEIEGRKKRMNDAALLSRQ